MSSHKTFRVKSFLDRKQKKICPTQLTQMKSSNKIRYNSKYKHWKKTRTQPQLGLGDSEIGENPGGAHVSGKFALITS
ncbi:putative 60S ribosomal protein L39-like 5 [Trichosurus vulpecula]|uniref:putative 60S ribosomal protein L39-like 5 n=1 Tax=Trichosurus vulpecula TaxID=9337 RepID=UPI00186B1C98|nr:putative 60S ribosomal protein L39-like 5 [Trichosurus vulpecula]